MSQPGPNPETAALGAAAGAAPTVGAAVGAGAIGVGAMNALGAVVNQGSGGGEGGGRFEYTEEQLRSIKKRWEDLAAEYDEDIVTAEPLRRVRGPGNEYVSARYALAANESGQKVIDSLIERRDYCRAQARKCKAALGEYTETEDEAAREMRRQNDPDKPL